VLEPVFDTPDKENMKSNSADNLKSNQKAAAKSVCSDKASLISPVNSTGSINKIPLRRHNSNPKYYKTREQRRLEMIMKYGKHEI
jgi:hypothetical protein